ncbi:helix-turn-helix domain-containing protein [Allokutzneria sp. A3M-2-11 16]|uniref:helix-turn-helix domain-containing protein n=1 Tax=Allokutzneria sp. A3M-2-11 16 TaxID=2962043 RepID=UPI0020B877E9|nr:helix-turn-helix transcriptional regulator [Allokutzneria sp. A3M-2-11 16]MCP3797977.1 helix-turn-helix domain-containing protein [Allokutzneria sp. A3M-2-11 16]
MPLAFWHTEEMRTALNSWHMGKVIRAFRTHPFHETTIPQSVAATWNHLTQAQLSRIENGPRLTDLIRLMQWAHVLDIPADLLWFKVPTALPESDGVLDAHAPDPAACDHESARRASSASAGNVVLPVIVDGRPVLLPLNASTLATNDLGALLDHVVTSDRSGVSPDAATDWDAVSPQNRRWLLKHSVAAAAAFPALDLAAMPQVAAALEDARRYLDGSVVEYFSNQLDQCKANDGSVGASRTLPAVLTILRTIEQYARDVKPVVRRQLLSVGAQGAEFAGWLYRDAYDPLRAGFWRDRATEWAQEAGDFAMQGYILLKKAQAAYDDRDALRMLTLSQAAQDGPWSLPIKVRAEIAQQEARGFAMLGEDNALVERKLDEAHQLLADVSADSGDHQLGAHYNTSLLTLQTAICYTEAGQPRRATELYREWLSTNHFSRRDYGYFLSLMASTLALSGEPDEAARTGVVSAALAAETNSQRTVQELHKVLDTLKPWENRAGVRELREAVTA